MKKISFVSQKNNGFVGQFKSLNDDEMISLRGGGGGNGGSDPLPPGSGEDLPIDLTKLSVQRVLQVTIPLQVTLPVAASASVVL